MEEQRHAAAGTTLVSNINPGSENTYFSDFTTVGSTLYFVASRAFEGQEVWRSNGTAAGTVVLKNIVPEAYGSSYPSQLTNVNGTLYFAARDSIVGNTELFKSDGTSAGTVVVEGVDSLMNSPTNLTNVNGVLYFSAFEELGNTGIELWRSNGTLAGTTLVKDIVPGANSSSPQKFFKRRWYVVFTVDQPTTGEELWKSDGTASGTALVSDLWPGPFGSDPSNLRMLGSLLTFHRRQWRHRCGNCLCYPLIKLPVLTVPASAINATEDTSVALTGIVVADPDADVADVQVTLTAASGLLTVNTTVPGGVSATKLTGNGTSTIVITAPLAAINATLSSATGLSLAALPIKRV